MGDNKRRRDVELTHRGRRVGVGGWWERELLTVVRERQCGPGLDASQGEKAKNSPLSHLSPSLLRFYAAVLTSQVPPSPAALAFLGLYPALPPGFPDLFMSFFFHMIFSYI